MTWFVNFFKTLLTRCPNLKLDVTRSNLFFRPFSEKEVEIVFNKILKNKIDFENETDIFIITIENEY